MNAPALSSAPKEAHTFEKKHAPKKPAHGRAFDRKSGTGRWDDGVKKNVVGKGNWGEPVDGQLMAETVDAEETAKAVEEVVDPEAEAAAAARAAQEAEEAKYKTLDAFLATKGSAKWTETAPRKANEGSDENKWKNAKVLVKEEDEMIIVGKVCQGEQGEQGEALILTRSVDLTRSVFSAATRSVFSFLSLSLLFCCR